MRKIMILGAGIYQVPLIRTAKRMGLYTVVVSIRGNYPGFALADKIYELDTRDCEGILAAAQAEHIDGICTSGTDVAVATIGYVCEKMGFCGIPLEAARIVTDKAKMKEAFLNGGVSAAYGLRAYSPEEAAEAAQKTGYPAVIKRVDSSGSRGISVVSEPSQIPAAFSHAICASSKDYVLVEAMLHGAEIGVDGFVQDGILTFLAPHQKFVYHGADITVPIGHAFPYRCSESLLHEITRQMQAAVTAAGLDHCPVNADVFVDGETVSIIEIGGRTGATCIPELISLYYGFDFYEKMIRSALGETVTFSCADPVPCMAKLLFSPADGTLTAVDEAQLSRLCTASDCLPSADRPSLTLDYSIGQSISAMRNGTDRIGHVICAADQETVLDQWILEVQRCIELNGKPLNQWFQTGKETPCRS